MLIFSVVTYTGCEVSSRSFLLHECKMPSLSKKHNYFMLRILFNSLICKIFNYFYSQKLLKTEFFRWHNILHFYKISSYQNIWRIDPRIYWVLEVKWSLIVNLNIFLSYNEAQNLKISDNFSNHCIKVRILKSYMTIKILQKYYVYSWKSEVFVKPHVQQIHFFSSLKQIRWLFSIVSRIYNVRDF